MTKKQTRITPEDEYNYADSDFLAEYAKDKFVSSSMFGPVFVPSKRLSTDLAKILAQNVGKLDDVITAKDPIFSVKISQPYWKIGKNKRDFDAVNCDVYGSVCLADDRHLLDTIIAHGGLIAEAQNYTLRQTFELCRLDVAWEHYPDQSLIDKHNLNRGVYILVAFTQLCKGLGIKNTKPNRQIILSRLQRLSIMQMHLTFEKEGEPIKNRSTKVKLVDHEYHAVCVPSSVRNKSNIKSDTLTHLLINVNSFYYNSLNKDETDKNSTHEGILTRERFLNDYRYLNGNNSVVDFFKYIDSNERSYIHEKYLSDLVFDYYSKKNMEAFNINLSAKVSATMKIVVEMKEELAKRCDLILKPSKNPDSRFRGQDYQLMHIPQLEQYS